MNADPREAELPPITFACPIDVGRAQFLAGLRIPAFDLSRYLLALTDAQLSALGLTRRRAGQPKGDETVLRSDYTKAILERDHERGNVANLRASLAASEVARKRVEGLAKKWAQGDAIDAMFAEKLHAALAKEPESEGQPAEGVIGVGGAMLRGTWMVDAAKAFASPREAPKGEGCHGTGDSRGSGRGRLCSATRSRADGATRGE